MQALLGKTGKDGLKRQVTSLDPLHVDMAKADFAFEKYLKENDLETIRDVSAGAATFYVWVSVQKNGYTRSCTLAKYTVSLSLWRRGGLVVSAWDFQLEGRWFESLPLCCFLR